jgi:endoglucanase
VRFVAKPTPKRRKKAGIVEYPGPINVEVLMTRPISRRAFVGRSLAAGALLPWLGSGASAAPGNSLPAATPEHLPRWRGFNLLEKFNARNDRFREEDFAWIAEWGFNFVRLPMDYRVWTEENDWMRLRETTLREIDEAVELGRKHGVHVQLNFHRAPGYTVARPPEPRSLWTDEEAQRVCALHWAHFAKRYRGIPNTRVSFNLFNEPATVDPAAHRRVVDRVATAIREEDPDRLIVCDGRDYGKTPPEELLGLNVATATRGYEPFRLTHYDASWVNGADQWPEPTYPLVSGNVTWNLATMRERLIAPWQAFSARGVGVMVGEFGCHNRSPHEAVVAWLRDVMILWQEARWGWALWNLRGSFGIVNSGRRDVAYEDWRGHKLDRVMLEILRQG